jgi:mono/diheme cytochrome c family protein
LSFLKYCIPILVRQLFINKKRYRFTLFVMQTFYIYRIKKSLDMKKMLLIFSAAAIFGCAQKTTPAGADTGNPGGGQTMISKGGGAPSSQASSGSSNAAATPAILPSGSTSAKIPATPVSSSAPEVLGQSTFNAKCSRCHGLKVTGDYTADRWVSIMQVMAGRAGLTDTEKENVLAYVKANSKK